MNQPSESATAEMTHVRIHRLTARYREERGAKHREANGRAGSDQIEDRVCGLRAEDDWIAKYSANAKQPNRNEPEQHDRAEDAADKAGALRCTDETARSGWQQ